MDKNILETEDYYQKQNQNWKLKLEEHSKRWNA